MPKKIVTCGRHGRRQASRPQACCGTCVTLYNAMDRNMTDEIRRILRDHGRLAVDVDQLDPSDDLYQAGMTSHASVNVMLGLEDAFDVEFPDSMLKRSSFETIAAIEAAVTELGASVAS